MSSSTIAVPERMMCYLYRNNIASLTTEATDLDDDECKVTHVSIPLIVSAITGGGCLSAASKMKLGEYLKDNMSKYMSIFEKVQVTVKQWDGQQPEPKLLSIKVIHYPVEYVNLVWGFVAEWLSDHHLEVAYAS